MKKLGTQVPFLVVEYKKIEKYLEKQASIGRKLEKVTYHSSQGFYFTFEKIEPQEIKYCIDLTEKTDAEYLELCKDSGWEYICSTRKMNFFSTTDRNAIEIQTDLEIEAELVKKAIYRREIFKPILYGIIALLIAVLYLNPIDVNTTTLRLYVARFIGLFCIGYGIFCFAMVIKLFYIVKNRTWNKDKTITPIFRHMYYPFTLIMISNCLLSLSSDSINGVGSYFFGFLAILYIVLEVVNYIRSKQ